MMKFTHILAGIILLTAVVPAVGSDKGDSAFTAGLFTASYAVQFPGGDLARRFGINSNVGGNILFKSGGNWLSGFSANFLFGDNVKEDDLFSKLSTSEDYMIDKVGTFAEIYLYERGYQLGAQLGKILSTGKPNPNSGILLMAGGGYLQHKIRIENPNKSAPQVQGDYRRGYDRLTGGFFISQFAGYVYFSNKKATHFFGGIEITEAWTKSLRAYDFDRMAADTEKRFDLLWGFRIGWILPFYRKTPSEFYYY